LKGDISQREIAEAGQGTAGIPNYPKQGSTYYPGGLYYQRNIVQWKFAITNFSCQKLLPEMTNFDIPNQ